MASNSDEVQGGDPAWMSEDFQEKWHKDNKDDEEEEEGNEASPLFGTGILNLIDPEKAELSEKAPAGEKADYGSTQEKEAAAPRKKESRSAAKDKWHEEDDEEKAALTKEPVVLARPHQPSQNPCLWLFHTLEGVAILSSLSLLFTQAIPLFMGSTKSSGGGGDPVNTQIGALNLILKFYVAVLCLLFIVTEANLPVPFVRSSQILQTYSSRGFLYSFVGLVTTNEAYSEQVQEMVSNHTSMIHVQWMAIFMQLSAWFMLCTGVVYMLLGLCCLRRLRDKMKQKEIDDWKEYREQLKKYQEQK